MTMTEPGSKSSGDSSESGSASSGSFLFRPSKLTTVAEKMFENCKSVVEELPKPAAPNLLLSNKKDVDVDVVKSCASTSTSEKSSDNWTPAVSNGESTGDKQPPLFVFGRNIIDRVTGKPEAETGGDNCLEKKAEEPESSEDKKESQPAPTSNSSTIPCVTTGEEGEKNLLQMHCKLHVYDKSSSEFKERGRGILRLNRVAAGKYNDYRIVTRSEGRQHVMLNCKLWKSMLLEAAGPKRVKLSATDPTKQSEITVFVITGIEVDIQKLMSIVQDALDEIKTRPSDENKTRPSDKSETKIELGEKRKIEDRTEEEDRDGIKKKKD